ncbi:MAG: universal stress protein [Dehalococcoidia bacterium]|nr:universal stress protein [Dehalococcoidia bacterium]
MASVGGDDQHSHRFVLLGVVHRPGPIGHQAATHVIVLGPVQGDGGDAIGIFGVEDVLEVHGVLPCLSGALPCWGDYRGRSPGRPDSKARRRHLAAGRGGLTPDQTPGLSKIIVPLDGSGLAEAALQPAERLARGLGPGLLLVQMVDPRILSYVGPEMSGTYQNLYTSLDRTAKDYLTALAAGPAKAGLAVETAVLQGLPGGSISDLARNTPGSLVVMSSHGRSGLSRWALGSVAEKVARDSLALVLILQSRVVRQQAG